MKNVKIEWCENFIKSVFKKHVPFENGGIETGCFWSMAERSGLWERGTYGTPMSSALEKLTNVDIVSDDSGAYLYSVFRLKSAEAQASGIKPPMAGPKPCRKKRDGYRGLMFDKFPWFLM